MLIPENIFWYKNKQFYISAAFGDRDNRSFFNNNKLRNKY